MMQDHFRECLETMDTALALRIWHEVMPHLPLPKTEAEAEIVMHIARTQTESVRFRARAYSHAWLRERGLPSCLPDELRPRAQQICPVTVATAGIAVKNRHEVALLIRGAMEGAVLDEGLKHPPTTKRAILSARAKVRFQLLGVRDG